MKTALITGGSQGLGKEIAKQLVAINYKVILLARRTKHLKAATQEIGSQATYYECDITDKTAVEKVMTKIKAEYSTLELLVNNAGVWVDDQLQVKKPQKMKQALETNVLGQIYVTEAALPLLKQNQVTRIFNVISTAAVRGMPSGNNTHWKTYGASKWGLRGYTHALREELRETKVQVLQFFPGGFESNLYENAGRDNPHYQPWMMKTQDVAEIAVFMMTRPVDIFMEEVAVSKFVED